jgi:hypothetical protein
LDTKSEQQTDAQDTASAREQAQTPIPKGEDREMLLKYYHQMVLIRRFEEKTVEMYQKARIGGYCHLNLGEEATVVGFCAALEPEDYVYTNYREHGYAIGRGISPEAVMAELFGKETGCSHGRGGSMHLFDINRHFMGGYAIVGGQIPLGTGAAFAVAYRGSPEVVVCQMGEGTTNGGPFYESVNLAKIYHLPIIYFVVNNLYGMGLRVEQGSAVSEIYRKACAFFAGTRWWTRIAIAIPRRSRQGGRLTNPLRLLLHASKRPGSVMMRGFSRSGSRWNRRWSRRSSSPSRALIQRWRHSLTTSMHRPTYRQEGIKYGPDDLSTGAA